MRPKSPSHQAGLSSFPGVSRMTIRITDDTPQAEIEECLAHICHSAKRCIPKVGSEEYPTEWDRRHSAIDAVLGDWQRVRATA